MRYHCFSLCKNVLLMAAERRASSQRHQTFHCSTERFHNIGRKEPAFFLFIVVGANREKDNSDEDNHFNGRSSMACERLLIRRGTKVRAERPFSSHTDR